jgi:hypothetical protein
MSNNTAAGYIGAIRGPVLLLTLGIILAIDHFGSYGFSRTWPVLIIVIGLMKLLERSLAARPEHPAGPEGPAGMMEGGQS